MPSLTENASLAVLAKQRNAAADSASKEEEVFFGKGELSNPTLVLSNYRREEVDDAVGRAIAREFVRITKPSKRRRVVHGYAVNILNQLARYLVTNEMQQVDMYSHVSSLTAPQHKPDSTSSSPLKSPERGLTTKDEPHYQTELDEFWTMLLGRGSENLPESPVKPRWKTSTTSRKRAQLSM